MTPARVKSLEMVTSQGHAGVLGVLVRESQFQVRYSDEALEHAERAISLTMPVRPAGYGSNRIPPIFGMRLPEGFVLNWLFERFGKTVDLNDEMNLLALVATPSMGRAYVRNPADPDRGAGDGVPLSALLPARGTEGLFRDLLERFTLNTAIAGVQPKVVVPGARQRISEKSSLRTPDLIVKNDPDEYPGLSENEFHCMSVCRAAGLQVPKFHLSEDRSLFITERFDMAESGSYLGFEEVCALMGKPADQKYVGSYGMAAKAVALNSAPARRLESLERFYAQLVLCCLLRNGDAHLKNWGVLYGTPMTAGEDATLCPAYDMVCTTAFIPRDTLALSLGGSKAWPDRQSLERFGHEHCEVRHPAQIIDELRDVVSSYKPPEQTPMWALMRNEFEASIAQLAATGTRRRH